MRELTRVKQYMAKIKDAEENAARQNGAGARLDKEAAGRFIKHALVRPWHQMRFLARTGMGAEGGR